MRVFTQAEIESLATQPLGRIARVGAAGGTAASNTGSFEHTARDDI